MSGSISIFRASSVDIPLIRKLAAEVFPVTYSSILSPEQTEYMMEWMYSGESLKEQIETGHVFYIAGMDSVPCGYASVQDEGCDEQGCRVFHLQKIYVLPSYHGKGVGSALFDRILSHVRENASGRCRLRLNVNRFNSARTFYEKKGMAISCQGDFPIGNGFFMNDYIMTLDL